MGQHPGCPLIWSVSEACVKLNSCMLPLPVVLYLLIFLFSQVSHSVHLQTSMTLALPPSTSWTLSLLTTTATSLPQATITNDTTFLLVCLLLPSCPSIAYLQLHLGDPKSHHFMGKSWHFLTEHLQEIPTRFLVLGFKVSADVDCHFHRSRSTTSWVIVVSSALSLMPHTQQDSARACWLNDCVHE